MVGTPGLEPGSPIKATDFKSVVFTNFTTVPKVLSISFPQNCKILKYLTFKISEVFINSQFSHFL